MRYRLGVHPGDRHNWWALSDRCIADTHEDATGADGRVEITRMAPAGLARRRTANRV